MTLKRLIYTAVGFVCLGLGAIGAALPILPTVPFFLATVICFANSSPKLHNWFVKTGLYKKNVEPFLQKKGMTIKTKLSIMIFMTLFMSIGFYMMGNVPLGRAVLGIVWIGHIIYFAFCVKTMKTKVQTR